MKISKTLLFLLPLLIIINTSYLLIIYFCRNLLGRKNVILGTSTTCSLIICEIRKVLKVVRNMRCCSISIYGIGNG